MQIEIFSLPDEFVAFVSEAVGAIGANLYATAIRDQPLKRIEATELLTYQHYTCKIQVAYPSDFAKIALKAANDLYRADIFNMVTIQFGRSSADQIECHLCLADTSDTSAKFAKAIKKAIKGKTRSDLVDADVGLPRRSKYYYTEAAASEGKRFVQSLGSKMEFVPAPRGIAGPTSNG